MHKLEFDFHGQKTLFQISQDIDFANSRDELSHYDYVYRLVDISGNLLSEIDKFDGQCYGFGTIVKMSVKHLPKLDENIRKMVDNVIEGKSITDELKVNTNDNPKDLNFYFEKDGIDFVALVKIKNDNAYIMIFDSMPNYNNYHFLFSGIHNFNDKNMSYATEQEHMIEDKKNNFYFYFGDEQTDEGFNDWLEEEAPKLYKEIKKLKIKI